MNIDDFKNWIGTPDQKSRIDSIIAANIHCLALDRDFAYTAAHGQPGASFNLFQQFANTLNAVSSGLPSGPIDNSQKLFKLGGTYEHPKRGTLQEAIKAGTIWSLAQVQDLIRKATPLANNQKYSIPDWSNNLSLLAIAYNESNWNPHEPTNSAHQFGILQIGLEDFKAEGVDTSLAHQIIWDTVVALRRVKRVYGTPEAALTKWYKIDPQQYGNPWW
jgi:hypothetical protein